MAGTATDVTIRSLTELDIDPITRIDERITGAYRPDEWERRVAYYVRRDPAASVVAEAEGRVVGFMLGEVRSGEFGLEEPTGWIEVLGVDPAFRGQAVGRRLADAVLGRFRERGARTVRTLVETKMAEIARFFESVGFRAAPVAALEMRLNDP